MKERSEKRAPDGTHNTETGREEYGAENDTEVIEHGRQSVVEKSTLNDEERPQGVRSAEDDRRESEIAEELGDQELVFRCESWSDEGTYLSGKDYDHKSRKSHRSHSPGYYCAEIFFRSFAIRFQEGRYDRDESGSDTAGDENIEKEIGE